MAEPNGTARWQLWVSLASVALALIGALMGLFWTANSALQKASELEGRVTAVEEIARADRTEVGVMRAQMSEIDTQLRASIDDRNISHAWDLRVESVLWERAFDGKSHLPIDNAVYPNIANGRSQ